MVYVLRVNNVCQALPAGMEYLTRCGRREESRAGEVLVAPEPVATVTLNPWQRVLFNSVRDANPFFHLYEAVWMLGGRRDAAPLNSFVKTFGRLYGEPGTGEVHGAYGHRWRSTFGFDQLDAVVKRLTKNDKDRQAVIQMWDCTSEHHQQVTSGFNLKHGNDDLRGDWRDRPCNTHVYLRVRGDRGMRDEGHGNVSDYDDRVLDLCVLCRSNDMLWGAHGANAVHFSVLQEYLAARIGVAIGTMTQFSWNYHAYVTELERLSSRVRGECEHLMDLGPHLLTDRYVPNHDGSWVETTPMFDRPYAIDEDVRASIAWFDGGLLAKWVPSLQNAWFWKTWGVAMFAHSQYREGDYEGALNSASRVEATDWRVACVEWLERRAK